MKKRKQLTRRLLFSVFALMGAALYWCVQSSGKEFKPASKKAETINFNDVQSETRVLKKDAAKPEAQELKNDAAKPEAQELKNDAAKSEAQELKKDVAKSDAAKPDVQLPKANSSEIAIVKDFAASRISATQIGLWWNRVSDGKAFPYSQYIVMRRNISDDALSDAWEKITSVSAKDGGMQNGEDYGYAYIDTLPSPEPVQYEYRIDALAGDGTLLAGGDKSRDVASNVLVCIDPGHYKGRALSINDGSYVYEEGSFTIKVGLALRDELAAYGISAYMTRETDSITIGGYTNKALDQGHLRLRGEYAAGSNLFLSVHTNANNTDANGYDTCGQPLGINKTVIIANQPAYSSEKIIKIANEIGAALTKTSYRLGLSFTDQFEQVGTNGAKPWTDGYNDSLNVKGTVCYRQGNDGDYYAVLNGSAAVGVPGLIIEHGYHTVQEVRKAAMTGDLAAEWAKADAEGIARGFGFRRGE